MANKIFIGVAWPYANGSLHLGHIAGCYLPADIFARFNRMIGNEVLMVSGSDEHGTPITITAEKEGITPQEVVDRFNKEHTENMKQFGISFDLFTRTTTKNHEKMVQEIFNTLYKKNHIFKQSVESFYCNHCNRFLPDRYIEGTCPICNYENARGDQCDECGQLLDPKEIINVRCKLCSSTPELRITDHLFFSLSNFEQPLLDWLKDKTYWKSSVLKFTQNWLKDGLRDRAITRDIHWGVPVPLEGFDEKRIYVWFDAVIGYLSASKQWALLQNDANKWQKWWMNPKAKHYYFLAKDNIPFHSIIWPSILMGYNDALNLPYDIPANEYLRLQGEQFSKSKGVGIWVPDVIKSFDVDAIRYYLSINMPENKDANWIWDDFIIKNNDELVGTYGNLIHRVLTFTESNFGSIPKKEILDQRDLDVEHTIKTTVEIVKNDITNCKFKQGLKEIMGLAKFGNIYFNEKEPWNLIKKDKIQCATTLHICLELLQALSICMAPYLPFSSQKIYETLGHTTSVHEASWEDATQPLIIGHVFEKPKPLFKKLELKDTNIEKDPFEELDLRVAEILDVKDHPNADKLYMFHINLGALGKRVLVAGMKPYYPAMELIGKKIVIVANLEPATIRGVKSYGMLLAAEDNKGVVSLLDPGDAKPGSIVGVQGIHQKPVKILAFDVFQQVELKINDEQQVIYQQKVLQTEHGPIYTDKPVEKNARIK
ncbi:MAG: methionine--tRNA ligase [Thermoplasmatota archaeon]